MCYSVDQDVQPSKLRNANTQCDRDDSQSKCNDDNNTELQQPAGVQQNCAMMKVHKPRAIAKPKPSANKEYRERCCAKTEY